MLRGPSKVLKKVPEGFEAGPFYPQITYLDKVRWALCKKDSTDSTVLGDDSIRKYEPGPNYLPEYISFSTMHLKEGVPR